MELPMEQQPTPFLEKFSVIFKLVLHSVNQEILSRQILLTVGAFILKLFLALFRRSESMQWSRGETQVAKSRLGQCLISKARLTG